MYWTIPPMWKGQTVAVLASGQSMSQAMADKVWHLPRIVVNRTWELAPDAQIIYACDEMWWRENPMAVQCRGIKLAMEPLPGLAPNLPVSVRCMKNSGKHGFDHRQDTLRTHSNGGAQAVQVAAHAGAARILLLGFDMHGEHWHEPYPERFGNPNPERFARWIRRFRALALALKRMGVDVVNCTEGSALDSCRRLTIDQALDEHEKEAA